MITVTSQENDMSPGEKALVGQLYHSNKTLLFLFVILGFIFSAAFLYAVFQEGTPVMLNFLFAALGIISVYECVMITTTMHDLKEAFPYLE